MRMLLLHGRDDPAREMDGWGFAGPILEDVEALHVTYALDYALYFTDAAAARTAAEVTGWRQLDDRSLAVISSDGLLETKGGYFGAYELQIAAPPRK